MMLQFGEDETSWLGLNREQDLALLLKRLSEPIKGKQYFRPPPSPNGA